MPVPRCLLVTVGTREGKSQDRFLYSQRLTDKYASLIMVGPTSNGTQDYAGASGAPCASGRRRGAGTVSQPTNNSILVTSTCTMPQPRYLDLYGTGHSGIGLSFNCGCWFKPLDVSHVKHEVDLSSRPTFSQITFVAVVSGCSKLVAVVSDCSKVVAVVSGCRKVVAVAVVSDYTHTVAVVSDCSL